MVIHIVTQTRKILANNIAYFRLKNNWSQEDLAELLGTSSVYVSQMENAKRNISCDYIDNLSKVFKVNPSELLESRLKMDIKRINRRNKR